ncbi:hypothetical protein HH214_06005 [Mucilaginibacter robiniae]|uniref:DUF3299 domain-containing protein n=1 Tax=Mucilaginibacter robiniae TaxID=2728022 RepID=A0A7L5ED12_9SPHI|nr:hypothetical protein HH214_06005 [Mucilaginibacter robiniae]
MYLFCTNTVYAQRPHLASDQIDSFNWGIIGLIKFNQVSSTEVYPVYSETVKRFENKPFELQGYMIPVQSGRNQNCFLLATLPVNQCYFCGKNGVPIMILVNMSAPIQLTFKSIKVTGKLTLENTNAVKYVPVSLEHAVLLP